MKNPDFWKACIAAWFGISLGALIAVLYLNKISNQHLSAPSPVESNMNHH